MSGSNIESKRHFPQTLRNDGNDELQATASGSRSRRTQRKQRTHVDAFAMGPTASNSRAQRSPTPPPAQTPTPAAPASTAGAVGTSSPDSSRSSSQDSSQASSLHGRPTVSLPLSLRHVAGNVATGREQKYRDAFVWDDMVKDAIVSTDGAIELLRSINRTLAPAIGALTISFVKLKPYSVAIPGAVTNGTLSVPLTDKNSQVAFNDIFQGADQAKLVAGIALIVSPIIEQLSSRLKETPFTAPHHLAKEQAEVLQNAARGFFGTLESVAGAIMAVTTVGAIAAPKDVGGAPIALATVGACFNGLVAAWKNVDMHSTIAEKNLIGRLTSHNKKTAQLAEKVLDELHVDSRGWFALAGTGGLGMTLASGAMALKNYHGEDPKALWFVESFLPLLTCLYTLGTSLFAMTLHLHRTPREFSKVKTFPTKQDALAADRASIHHDPQLSTAAASSALERADRRAGGTNG